MAGLSAGVSRWLAPVIIITRRSWGDHQLVELARELERLDGVTAANVLRSEGRRCTDEASIMAGVVMAVGVGGVVHLVARGALPPMYTLGTVLCLVCPLATPWNLAPAVFWLICGAWTRMRVGER